MASRVTPEAALTFLKVTIVLCFSRPLPKNASRFRVICFKTLRFLVCLNAVVLIVPTIYTLYLNDYDLPKMTKLWCLLAPFLQVPLQIALWAFQYGRLQYLISEMERNFECAESDERDIYQRYTDRCIAFYAMSTLSVFFTAVAISIVAPLATDQVFPTDVKYPFSVERTPLRMLIYGNQFVVIWQCFSSVCLCSFIAFLIWFAAARFDILSKRLRTANDICDVILYARQHIKLIRYAQEVIIAVRSILLLVIIMSSCGVIAGGLIIVSRSMLADKLQFILLCIAGLTEVYSFAWPADYLIDASSAVARAVYETRWYSQDTSFKSNVRFMLLRSQTPVVISVSSFLPALSLNYYSSYVSTAFSYLMTLRILFMEDEAIKD